MTLAVLTVDSLPWCFTCWSTRPSDWTSPSDGSYCFITSNSVDFSAEKGDRRFPHPDIADLFKRHHVQVLLRFGGREDGRWGARCRVRDFDGATRRVARWGTSKAGAQAALQDELRKRTGQRTEILKPNSGSARRPTVDGQDPRPPRRLAADTDASCLNNQVLPSSAGCA